MRLRDCHYWISLLLSLSLFPALLALHLPLKFDWMTLGIAYWLVLAAQSIFVSAILCVIGLPPADALNPLLARYRREPLRILLAVIYFLVLGWAFTWSKAVILTVDTIALIEVRDRHNLHYLRQTAWSLLFPALYLFLGFLLVFAYNDVIASVRFPFAYDSAFNTLDRIILHGGSISALAHWAIRTFPIPFFSFLEFIYFGMFPQIGAAIFLLSSLEGKHRSLQFVGAILLAYYFALALFYLWPSQGPYYLSPAHFSRFPDTLQTWSIQKSLMTHALALWNHEPIRRISTDFFIAFPCMHIAQPLIVMWFLRRWKRMVIVLCAYDALLVVAILFLEWHYFVDLLGGVLVAATAIAITDSSFQRRGQPRLSRQPSIARKDALSL